MMERYAPPQILQNPKAILFVLALISMLYAAPLSGISPSATPQTTPAMNISIITSTSPPISQMIIPSDLLASPAFQYALMSGPYAYAAIPSSVLVIDTSTLKIVSTIKPDVDKAHVDGVTVSPDGKYVFMAYSWEVYQDDPYGGSYLKYGRVIRLNATSEQPIDYYELDNIYLEHLAMSPDGVVYVGYQDYYYPSNAGVMFLDFNKGASWKHALNYEAIMESFAFSPDSNDVFYSGWYRSVIAYDIDWSEQLIHPVILPGNSSDDDQYPRSMAVGKGGRMLYAAIHDTKGIFAMNTEDGGKQMIPTDFYPLALATSADGETLYAAGYSEDVNGNPIYGIHAYSGLKELGPYNDPTMDYTLALPSDFSTTDWVTSISPPAGSYPSAFAITSDGKFAFISTLSSDSIMGLHGDGIIVFDLQYKNQVKVISEKDSLNDIAVAGEKIIFSPPPDYSWIKQFGVGSLSLINVSLPFVPTTFYPENGTFASHYQDDLFSVNSIFSDTLDNTTVNLSSFWLSEKSGANVSGKVSAFSKFAVFMPTAQLKADTDYVAHISKSIKSKSGSQLTMDYTWSFTTKNTSSQANGSISVLLNLSHIGKIAPLNIPNLTQPQIPGNNSGGSQNATPPGNASQQIPHKTLPQQQNGSAQQGGNQTNQSQGGAQQNQTQQPAQNGTIQPPANQSQQQGQPGTPPQQNGTQQTSNASAQPQPSGNAQPSGGGFELPSWLAPLAALFASGALLVLLVVVIVIAAAAWYLLKKKGGGAGQGKPAA